jgi:hypothetical protein
MASLIVGLSGRKRSGKDAFAERLVDAHGFTRIAFADPLKAVAQRLNPHIRVEMDEKGLIFGPGTIATRANYYSLADIISATGWERAKEIREVRRLLQNLGVAVREEVDLGVWVDAAMRRAAGIDGPVVITDVRFPNEFHALTFTRGGFLVRIERPGLPQDDLHVSETALDGFTFDFGIVNDGTIDDLHRKADEVLTQMYSHQKALIVTDGEGFLCFRPRYKFSAAPRRLHWRRTRG